MMESGEAKFYTQRTSTINGRGVWHYLISSPIGMFHIIAYEQTTLEIKRFIMDNDNDKAESKYNQICRGIVNGKL